MVKIPNRKWASKDLDGKDTEDNTVNVIMMAIDSVPPEAMPRGFQKTLTYSRIAKAIKNAKKFIEFENAEHDYIKQIIKDYFPATFGMNKNVMKVVEEIMEAKEENNKLAKEAEQGVGVKE